MTLRFIYRPSPPFVMYSIGIAAQLLGICRKTLRRWDRSNKISLKIQ
ncbi:MAG: hypothetical protein ACOC44_15455 [Promethearchaeia archaeon]